MKEIHKIKEDTLRAHNKKRVAAYARVSENSQRLSHSLSSQKRYYSEYIQKNPDWIFAGVYSDNAVTGTRTKNRHGFNSMMTDCEAGRIDIILVKSISRLARNTVDLLNTVRHLKSLGIAVVFEKENINSMSGDGELMLSVLASFAQEESRSISENVKWSTRKRFEQGIPNGRVRVFGYRYEGDSLVIVPQEAEVVRRIFKSFLAGQSPRTVARELNNEGILTRSGCKWSDSSIRTILKNVTYTGNMLLQKGYTADPISKHRRINRGELPRYFVEKTHEPIIEEWAFKLAAEEFERRSRKK